MAGGSSEPFGALAAPHERCVAAGSAAAASALCPLPTSGITIALVLITGAVSSTVLVPAKGAPAHAEGQTPWRADLLPCTSGEELTNFAIGADPDHVRRAAHVLTKGPVRPYDPAAQAAAAQGARGAICRLLRPVPYAVTNAHVPPHS